MAVGHSIHTDNTNLAHKVQLRKEAIKNLSQVNVLDLFAGENMIWNNFDCDKYYGIEKVKGKGKNLNADNIRVIASLDLSKFNVIDCDSYGVPINQLDALYNNSTLQKGTVIIYTAISSPLSALNKVVVDSFNLQKLYKKCKVLFTNKSIDLFYGYLYKLGVREVREYEEKSPTFVKKYGYFTVE